MSLRSHLNPSAVVGSIRLQLRHPSGANKIWVIVEGETDQKLFAKLLNGPQVTIELSHGRRLSDLQIAISTLLTETDRVIGIRDADFFHLEGRTEAGENIFLTDFHDAEMLIISSDKSYNSVVAEYLSRAPFLLREHFLQSIAFLGGLRWMNDRDNLELNFKGLGLGNFYEGTTLVLDEEKCLYEVMNRSPNKQRVVSKEEVIEKIKNISDFFNLCNGHDFQKAFALCVSSHSQKGVNDEKIGEAFRIAYRFEDFQETRLYSQLKAWSDNHQRGLFLTN